MPPFRIIAITGPTASGKSSLAVEAAVRLDMEIISADSRQVYRGMPVTTAVPDAAERRGVTHHLLEVLDARDYYSAARFEHDALAIIERARQHRANGVIVCGGSQMYLDALAGRMDPLPTISDDVRRRVLQVYDTQGLGAVLAWLEIIDPVHHARVDHTNPRRVIHAVEVTLQAGVPYSTLLTGRGTPRNFDIERYVIDIDRPTLFDRINRRVDRMVEQGMEHEARAFYPLRHLNSVNTVGFKEWHAHFDGYMDRPTTIERIKKNTRVYAKKQLTWLKRSPLPSVTLPADKLLQALCRP